MNSETGAPMEVAEINPTEEEISDSFVCCVCLDLLYKPIVLRCGHISCFWCVHRSMSFRGDSHCPVCRNPYQHFPTICQMLHFLLQKMYPIAYKRRELKTLEVENQKQHFSPPVFDYAKTRNNPLAKEDSSVELEQSKPDHSQSSKQITMNDVLCAGCEELLFRPVALNCGHVYCESCLVQLRDEVIRCRVCQSSNPNAVPKASLVLVQFLESQFPKEYALRGETVQLKEADFKGRTEACKKARHSPPSPNHRQSIHYGIGCDFCGMSPINGNRYKCMDCVEFIGFDLCNDCYNTPSKRPGRFNQHHTPDHKFELVPAVSMQQFLSSLRSQISYVVVGDSLILGSYSSEDSGNASTPFSLPDESNVQDGGSTPDSSTSAGPDRDDSEPTT